VPPSGATVTALWDNDGMAWKDRAKAVLRGGLPDEGAGQQAARSPGTPEVYRIGHEEDIVLDVNRKYLSTEVANVLMGEGLSEDSVDGDREVMMFRDETSQYEDSVRVELPDGRLVGWVTKADSETACLVIDSVSKARSRSSQRHPVRLLVTLYIDGFWPNYESGDDPNDPDVRGVDFDVFEIQIQDPIQAELL